MEEIKFPKWYQSTTGPHLSMTIKGVVGAFLPLLKNLFGIALISTSVDPLIDALVFVGFAVAAVYGYVRSKRTLGAEIQRH